MAQEGGMRQGVARSAALLLLLASAMTASGTTLGYIFRASLALLCVTICDHSTNCSSGSTYCKANTNPSTPLWIFC